jgi:Protein of unknown function (DUF1236)
MRSKLLLSTAALLAGIAVASAQDRPGGGAAPSPGASPSAPQGSPTQRGQDKQGQAQQGQKEQGQPQRGKEQTTGQAPQGQGGQKAGKDQDKDPGKAQTQRGQKEQTTGQGQREQAPTQAQPQRQPGQAQPGQAQQGQPQQGQAQQGQAQQGQTGGSVTLTTEQRTKIRQTVLVAGAPRVSSVNFALAVGTAVPTTVRVVEVAPVLVEIHPEWRGFFYFVVGDEIIIVDRNHRIVAVLAV